MDNYCVVSVFFIPLRAKGPMPYQRGATPHGIGSEKRPERQRRGPCARGVRFAFGKPEIDEAGEGEIGGCRPMGRAFSPCDSRGVVNLGRWPRLVWGAPLALNRARRCESVGCGLAGKFSGWVLVLEGQRPDVIPAWGIVPRKRIGKTNKWPRSADARRGQVSLEPRMVDYFLRCPTDEGSHSDSCFSFS